MIFFSSLFKPFGLTRWGRIFSSDIFNSPWHTDLTHLLFFDQLQIDSDEFDDPILTLSQDDILSSIYNLGREEKKLKWCRLLKTAQVLPHTKRGRSKAVETAQRLWCKSCKFATYILVDSNPKDPKSRVHPDPQRIHCLSKNKQVEDENVTNLASKYFWRPLTTFLLRQDRKEKTFFSILNFWFEATVHVYLIHRMRVTEGVSPVNWIKWHARYRPTFTALECESENYQKHNR